MTMFLRIGAIFVLAIRRLLSQWTLALATLVGLIVAIALTVSIPLYADGVYFRIFQTELTSPSSSSTTVARPPFAFGFQYVGSWYDSVEWEEVQPLDEYLSTQGAAALGIPRQMLVRQFKTDKFRLFPADEEAYDTAKASLGWIDFAFANNLEAEIDLLEGTFPRLADASANSTMEVLVSEELATELGLQVGENYLTYNGRATDDAGNAVRIPVRISGIWRAANPESDYWFMGSGQLKDSLLISEGSFLTRISPHMQDEVYAVWWYLVMDGSSVHAADTLPFLSRITAIQQRTTALLPNTRLVISPEEALRQYQESVSLLTLLLYAYSIPILTLILIFINLIVGLTVDRKLNEIAILRSRGAGMGQVVGIAVLEGLILGGLALAIGLPLSQWIAQMMGQTRSFLNFSAEASLRVDITPAALQIGLITTGIAIIAQVIPAIGAARHTIVTYKLERARQLRPPWWQRVWLDILLLLPAGYGTFLLRQQGNITLPGSDGSFNNDPFQNPLLLLIPALGIIALTLLFLRILPLLMAFLAWVTAQVGGVGILLATRQLARAPGFYTGPMLLLVLTLSLSAFTASLAQTLDFHLYDQTYYQAGADINLFESGESTDSILLDLTGGGDAEETTDEADSIIPEEGGPRWNFLPVSDYLSLPGVEAATRAGRYQAVTTLSGHRQEVFFLGIDRAEFAQTAFWRWDFAPSFLAELMNALALAPDGVLLPQDFMEQHRLTPGDKMQVEVELYGASYPVDVTVVGGFDLFPSWYPAEGPLIVGNLDYLFEQGGGQYPYQVWLRTASRIDPIAVSAGLINLNPRMGTLTVPFAEIIETQQSPERQGLFGILSVGFMAAALLTVLGFALYAFFSFRQRFIELGVLRAIGLSTGQMTLFLAWELAVLILTGLVLGTGLGVWVSHLFIPFLQVGSGVQAATPPYLVTVAWPAIVRIYALFGLLFVGALGVLTVLLLRMKIFEAVKLGETV